MLTVYCVAEIACDGEPCVAPFPFKEGPRAAISAVEPKKAAARKIALKVAKRREWQQRGDKWFCEYCVAFPPAQPEAHDDDTTR